MYGALREANICKIQPPEFADFRVEIVPNSTHYKIQPPWFADFRVEIVPNSMHFQN